ncbi:MAG: hypothetical protein ACRDJN_00635 [Chloroflexota bacterium]
MPNDERPPRRRSGGTIPWRPLYHLDAALRRFRARLARVRRDISVLGEVEARRPLTPAEARQMTHLRWGSESLRPELERLRAELAAATDRPRERATVPGPLLR